MMRLRIEIRGVEMSIDFLRIQGEDEGEFESMQSRYFDHELNVFLRIEYFQEGKNIQIEVFFLLSFHRFQFSEETHA